MKKTEWTAEQIDFLRRNYADHKTAWIAEQLGHTIKAVYQRAHDLGLRKDHNFLSSEASGRLQRGDHRGRLSQFKPGHTTWNKGKHYQAGGRSADTQFKKGEKPHTWHPIGHERISEGYLQRKLTDTGVTRRDYVNVHWLIWFERGLTIPPGHALVFKDGNRANVTFENLELISRAELMRRNTRHNLPPEVNEVIGLRAALVRKINKRIKAQEEASA